MRKPTLRLAREALRQSKGRTAFLCAAVVLSALFSLLPPLILQRILDEQLVPGRIDRLPALAALYLGSFILIGAADFWKGFELTALGQRLIRAVRRAMAQKLERLPVGFFTQNAPGVVTSRFLNDVESVSALFSDGVASMVADCFKIVGILVSIFALHWPLGLLTLALLPLIALLTAFFRRRILGAQKENLRQVGRVNGHIAESVRAVRMIKGFHKEAYMKARYEDRLRASYAAMDRVNWFDACYSPIIQIITACAVAAVFALANHGGALGVTIGTLSAAVTLIGNLFAPIDNLGTELQSIQTGLAGARSVDAFLNEPEEQRQLTPVDLASVRREGATLRFEHVSFAYAPDEPILTDIDLTLHPYEHVCLAGRTGVGKTTAFRVAAGLLEPTAGRVTLNGVDVRGIPNEQKRLLFGYVEQQFRFVRGDIATQLTLGDERITQKQVEEAMRFVGLHETVMALEQGYRTEARNGEMFSQGQKQLLCIARAIVSDPALLLLDEVTASLDAATEENVVSVLGRIDKTALSIAHRPSSIRGSDRVVWLENGRIQKIENIRA